MGIVYPVNPVTPGIICPTSTAGEAPGAEMMAVSDVFKFHITGCPPYYCAQVPSCLGAGQTYPEITVKCVDFYNNVLTPPPALVVPYLNPTLR